MASSDRKVYSTLVNRTRWAESGRRLTTRVEKRSLKSYRAAELANATMMSKSTESDDTAAGTTCGSLQVSHPACEVKRPQGQIRRGNEKWYILW